MLDLNACVDRGQFLDFNAGRGQPLDLNACLGWRQLLDLNACLARDQRLDLTDGIALLWTNYTYQGYLAPTIQIGPAVD